VLISHGNKFLLGNVFDPNSLKEMTAP
jgi:hypothetical protein